MSGAASSARTGDEAQIRSEGALSNPQTFSSRFDLAIGGFERQGWPRVLFRIILDIVIGRGSLFLL
jgi:hypothetical protein